MKEHGAIAVVPPPSLALSRHLYTYDELLAEFPESEQRRELWDGEIIMSPAPFFDHQEIVFRIARRLHDWVSSRKLGKVVPGPIDMVLSPHRVLQPDVAFVSSARLGIIQRAIQGPADLAVEVISLGNRNRDRIEKRDLYEQYGVAEYWIVDPEARTVEVLSLENDRYKLFVKATGDLPVASRVLPDFQWPASQVFFGD